MLTLRAPSAVLAPRSRARGELRIRAPRLVRVGADNVKTGETYTDENGVKWLFDVPGDGVWVRIYSNGYGEDVYAAWRFNDADGAARKALRSWVDAYVIASGHSASEKYAATSVEAPPTSTKDQPPPPTIPIDTKIPSASATPTPSGGLYSTPGESSFVSKLPIYLLYIAVAGVVYYFGYKLIAGWWSSPSGKRADYLVR